MKLETLININKQDFIGKGLQRACYQHPENKKLCIKIMHSNHDYSELCKEIAYYNKIQEKHKKYSLNFYAKYHGTVETNLGTGYVYDLCRDDNGMVSLTLEQYLKSIKFDREKLINPLLELKQNMMKYTVFFLDMTGPNILVNVENNAINLIIVDGLGGGGIYLI